MSDRDGVKRVMEALLLASDSALSVEKMAGILDGFEKDLIREALKELAADAKAEGRGILLEEVAGGWRLRTNPEYAPWIKKLFKVGAQKLSKAAMETLAIVAYKQPVTRGELEAVRGVDSGGVLATLMEKRFIRITGKKDAPGRPVVYGTTREFLETFDLKDLACLPSLKEMQKTEEEDALRERAHEEEAGEPQGRGAEGGGEEGGEGAGEEGAAEAREKSAAGAEGGAGEDTEDNRLGGDNVEEEG